MAGLIADMYSITATFYGYGTPTHDRHEKAALDWIREREAKDMAVAAG
jgi:hypothetical protein